ncbi:MAG: UDP-N-acetylglucosamine 1-carboxyvinyltransferase [Candidatus Cellulosilyticum pullistercoris]|uniref:UDP-N-acetylglucosamine 1-carboxyvinyltransferase n=1 Tax=Candidatus Cellulosilyticum pullistercoris TaxID=2838521 RepID=A0A9E2KAJ2_9FIRM|nr:UDP-N-acetylglucosamine 1-carboxyvinyltransferase [Candidatus Cellulosilyticum pullistercoris]
MSQYVIEGGKRLEGELQIGGSKNAVLPIIAATLLNEEVTYLENCPKILDVKIMIEILRELGCKVEWQEKTLMLDTTTLQNYDINEALVKKMRSSIILLGALMGRCGEARISEPGGCQLGARPIDLHLEALRKMNVDITETNGMISCKASHLRGAEINLKFPSVGATENIMLAATRCEGRTIIYNPAMEPEIVDLQNFLVACGAKITGAGTSKIIIDGVKKLNSVHYRVIPDRIIAGTYLVAAAITRGTIILNKVENSHLEAITNQLERMGCKIVNETHRLIMTAPKQLKSVDIITQPYPGFPTDMQSQMMALLCTCNETALIKENLFEARFKIVDELVKMGAQITVDDCLATIRGGHKLKGCSVIAKDLRGGAALVLAGLAAEGRTTVENIGYIKRGYENIVDDLSKLGAHIEERE